MRFGTINRVTFKTAPEWYEAEECGEKPFTVRTVTDAEYVHICHCEEIGIINTETLRRFSRRITFVRDITGALDVTLHNGNERLIVIQWEA